MDQDDGGSRLSEREQHDVEERARPRAAVLHETIRAEGERELDRPASALAWSGFAAGLSMGFSLVAMGLVRAALPDRPWSVLLVQLGYPIGFLIVIVGRQQLFTENTLTPIIPLLQNRDARTLLRVLRLWAIVLVTNVLGTFVFAWVIAKTGVFSEPTKHAFADIAMTSMSGGFGAMFLRAIFAGWLIALMVWMMPGVRSLPFIVIAITYVIGIGGLSHVIAGSVDAFYLVVIGDASFGEYVVRFFVPTLLGNVVGGAALVGALNHAQVAAETR